MQNTFFIILFWKNLKDTYLSFTSTLWWLLGKFPTTIITVNMKEKLMSSLFIKNILFTHLYRLRVLVHHFNGFFCKIPEDYNDGQHKCDHFFIKNILFTCKRHFLLCYCETNHEVYIFIVYEYSYFILTVFRENSHRL